MCNEQKNPTKPCEYCEGKTMPISKTECTVTAFTTKGHYTLVIVKDGSIDRKRMLIFAGQTILQICQENTEWRVGYPAGPIMELSTKDYAKMTGVHVGETVINALHSAYGYTQE